MELMVDKKDALKKMIDGYYYPDTKKKELEAKLDTFDKSVILPLEREITALGEIQVKMENILTYEREEDRMLELDAIESLIKDNITDVSRGSLAQMVVKYKNGGCDNPDLRKEFVPYFALIKETLVSKQDLITTRLKECPDRNAYYAWKTASTVKTGAVVAGGVYLAIRILKKFL